MPEPLYDLRDPWPDEALTEESLTLPETADTVFDHIAVKARWAGMKLIELRPHIDHLPRDEQENIKLRLALSNLHELQLTIEKNARRIAIEAIKKGYLSRVDAASMLGVHQGTVARWVKSSRQAEKESA